MTETWRPAPGFEHSHQVSDRGAVRSVDRTVRRTDGSTYNHPGQPMRLRRHARYGYLLVDLLGVTCPVADLVLTAFVGPRPAGQHPQHADGDRGNCALENLAWG